MEQAELAPHPLIVSDWKAITFDALFDMEEASGVEIICPDTITVNGKVGSWVVFSEARANINN